MEQTNIESKALQAVTQASALITHEVPMEVSGSDFQTPKLLLMQKMSELVDAGKAKPGDIIDSLTEEVIASPEKPVSFIPIGMSKVWFRYELKNNKREFWKVEKFSDNPSLQWEAPASDTVDGVTRHFLSSNDLAMLWTIILPFQIERGDVAPYILTLKGTSYSAGKKLVTLVTKKSVISKKKPCEFVYKLSCTKETNDKGTFYVFDISPDRLSTEEELVICDYWLDRFRGQS